MGAACASRAAGCAASVLIRLKVPVSHHSVSGRWTALAVALLLAIAPPASPLHAQRERLVLRAEQFGASALSGAGGGGGGATVRSGQRGLFATLAHRIVRQEGNLLLLVGAQYRRTEVGLPGGAGAASGGAAPATALHVLTADLWLLRTLNDTHSLVTVLRPGLYGDLGDAGSQLRLEGAMFVDRVLSPRATVGLGLSYASAFGEVLPIPVVHVVARPARQVLVDALLPARADVWWLPRKGLDVGLNASLAGAQYGLSAERRPAPDTDALQLANATLGPQVRWTPGGRAWQVTADGGVTVLRRLRYAADGTVRTDLSPGNVPYLRLGLQRLF
jgi:hypothetical protein